MGIKAGIIRPITLWPFPKEAYRSVAEAGKPILTVEMSMGQMVEDVKLAVLGKTDVYFYGRTGGMVPTPYEIVSRVEKILGGKR